MRFAVLFFVVLAAVGAFFLLGGTGTSAQPPRDAFAPIAQEENEPAAEAGTSNGPVSELPLELPDEEAVETAEPEPGDRTDATFSGQELVEFHGSALLQPKGQRPYPAVRGTIDLAILNHGQLVPVTVSVNQGKFRVEVPDRCRLQIDGGELEDQAVKFLGTSGAFTLDAALDYVLVGEPIPLNRLRVFEGTQRVPLAGVTVRRSSGGDTALMKDGTAVGEVIVEDAASPIDLPYMPEKRPIWLHVSANGYATTALLLDPQEANDKEVVLWPSATLTVRVTGPIRGRLKALVLHRHEPAADGRPESKRHFATFGMNTPGIETDPDATIFSLENIPALPLTLEARGFDRRGRETLLGTTTVELGPDQAGTVELRLQGE